LKKEEKAKFIEWMNKELMSAQALVLADYRGLTVAQITDLRNRCREAGVEFKVVKNTLMRMAVEGTPMAAIKEVLVGPTAMAWHHEDPGMAARILVDFAKERENEALELKAGAITGRLLSAMEVKNVLATLPNREELLSKLAGLMEAGPGKLHRTICAGPAKLARLLYALKEQREEKSA